MNDVVDIVVPCYNYARYLPGCVASALDQVGGRVRILIIDDCSSDNTAEVGAALAASDARITFDRHPMNRGHIATYNEGLIDWATSRYSVLLSADDLLAPGSLGRAVELMDANPSVSFCYGLATTFTDGETPLAPDRAPTAQIIPGARYLKHVCENGNPVPTPTAVVRTELQQQIGGYKKELPHSGDMEMWMRFALHGDVGIINSVQAFYRVHGASMSTQYYQNVVRDRREQLQACEEVLERSNGSIAGLPQWTREMAHRFAKECFLIGYLAFERGDLEACKQSLSQAAGFNPAITRTAWWKKMTVKCWIGPRRWSRLQRLLRLASSAPVQPPQPSHPARTGQLMGWWPDPTGP